MLLRCPAPHPPGHPVCLCGMEPEHSSSSGPTPDPPSVVRSTPAPNPPPVVQPTPTPRVQSVVWPTQWFPDVFCVHCRSPARPSERFCLCCQPPGRPPETVLAVDLQFSLQRASALAPGPPDLFCLLGRPLGRSPELSSPPAKSSVLLPDIL